MSFGNGPGGTCWIFYRQTTSLPSSGMRRAAYSLNLSYLNMSPQNLRLYEQYYQFHDPITFKMQPYRRAVSVNEVIAQQDLINTEFFNEFLAKDGLYYGINIYVYDKGNRNIGDFRIWRSRKRDNFDRRELEILDMIAPHFRNAMRNILFAKHRIPALDLDEIRSILTEGYLLTPRELDVASAMLEGLPDKKSVNRCTFPYPRCAVTYSTCSASWK